MKDRYKFLLKRYGVIGIALRLLERKKLISDKAYLYAQHHYYEKLTLDEYEQELGEWYKAQCGRTLDNIRVPKTFNDKIQWLKLNDNSEIRAICSDKLRVREYIKSIGVEGLHLIPLIGSWDSVEDIDFSSLPMSFVLKQNAGCKMNMIIKNKDLCNENSIKRRLDGWLKTTYGYNGMEVQYLNIPKKIIAEKYIQELGGDLLDYKIFCFNGSPMYIEVIGERGADLKHGHSAFFDLEWNLMSFGTMTYPRFTRIPSKPNTLQKMIDIAKELSAPFSFVRIDLYSIDSKVYFGEMTFTPTNGVARWFPESADYMLGELLDLHHE